MKVLYWILTLSFCLSMTFAGVMDLTRHQKIIELFTHLGYPTYLGIILGVGKLLGVLALLLSPSKLLKEWAYAGFTFDLIGATASHVFVNDPFVLCLMPLANLVLMIASYVSWKKNE